MRIPPLPRLILLLMMMAGPAARPGRAEGEAPGGAKAEAFFETRIRPLLAERCWKCHGAEKQWSGLRLDSRAGALKGGDNGPAVVPGKPEESVLLTAVRHEDELLKMPPKAEKL